MSRKMSRQKSAKTRSLKKGEKKEDDNKDEVISGISSAHSWVKVKKTLINICAKSYLKKITGLDYGKTKNFGSRERRQ